MACGVIQLGCLKTVRWNSFHLNLLRPEQNGWHLQTEFLNLCPSEKSFCCIQISQIYMLVILIALFQRLVPVQCIIRTNAGLGVIGPLGKSFNEILRYTIILTKKNKNKISSAKWWPCCLGLNVLKKMLDLSICRVFPNFCKQNKWIIFFFLGFITCLKHQNCDRCK